MNYLANSNRYSEMVYRVCGRSGTQSCLPYHLACGITLATRHPSKSSGKSYARRLTSGSRISTSRITMAPLQEAQSSLSGDCCARTLRHIETN